MLRNLPNRFNGFVPSLEAVKTANSDQSVLVATQLKLGVNEASLRHPLISGRYINQSLDARAQRRVLFIFNDSLENRL